MSEESTRVLKMLAEGKLTVEQANQLLEALGEERPGTAERCFRSPSRMAAAEGRRRSSCRGCRTLPRPPR